MFLLKLCTKTEIRNIGKSLKSQFRQHMEYSINTEQPQNLETLKCFQQLKPLLHNMTQKLVKLLTNQIGKSNLKRKNIFISLQIVNFRTTNRLTRYQSLIFTTKRGLSQTTITKGSKFYPK